MSSETDVCNSALILVGANRIVSLEEDSTEGRVCKELYPKTRDEILRMHPWNFAIKRIELAEISPVPIAKWDHQYQLPSDNLRAMNINESSIERLSSTREIAIEGDRLLTNSTEAFLEYIARITDVNLFDSLFSTALEHRLASKFAYALTNNFGIAKEHYALFKDVLIDARVADAHEGSPKSVIEDDLINVRGISSEDQRPFGF